MRLLIIRHGDPDYAIDGLTERGVREADALADRLVRENIDYAYSSPLGRARLTAKPTMARLGMEAEICPWLREFSHVRMTLPGATEPRIAWDLLPRVMAENPALYTKDWRRVGFIEASEIPSEYDYVTGEFDALLARHGYERDGINYRVLRENHGTVAFFCHFGLEAVLLSHLMNCSPYSIWQNACALPTSVSEIFTEERERGVASMRMTRFADLSHLYAAGIEPAFAARFCECYSDEARH